MNVCSAGWVAYGGLGKENSGLFETKENFKDLGFVFLFTRN